MKNFQFLQFSPYLNLQSAHYRRQAVWSNSVRTLGLGTLTNMLIRKFAGYCQQTESMIETLKEKIGFREKYIEIFVTNLSLSDRFPMPVPNNKKENEKYDDREEGEEFFTYTDLLLGSFLTWSTLSVFIFIFLLTLKSCQVEFMQS